MTESLLQQARQLQVDLADWGGWNGVGLYVPEEGPKKQVHHLITRQALMQFLDSLIKFLEWAKSEPAQFETPCLGQCPNYFRTKNATFWCTEVVDHEGPCHLPAIKGHRPTLTPTGQLERTHTLAIMAAVFYQVEWERLRSVPMRPDDAASTVDRIFQTSITLAERLLAEVEKRNL